MIERKKDSVVLASIKATVFIPKLND